MSGAKHDQVLEREAILASRAASGNDRSGAHEPENLRDTEARQPGNIANAVPGDAGRFPYRNRRSRAHVSALSHAVASEKTEMWEGAKSRGRLRLRGLCFRQAELLLERGIGHGVIGLLQEPGLHDVLNVQLSFLDDARNR